MSKTAWSVAPFYQGKGQWLRTDGTIVNTPTVETTPARQRFRVLGSERSVRENDLYTELTKAMTLQAEQDGTELWMELHDLDEEVQQHFNRAMTFYPEEDPFAAPALDFDRQSNVIVVFEFVSPQYEQVRGFVWASLQIDAHDNISVHTDFTYRSTSPNDGWTKELQRYRAETARKWMDGAAPFAPADLPWGKVQYGSIREGVSHLIEVCRAAAQLSEVNVPDRRDEDNITPLVCKATRSNYSQALYRQLLDVVQGVSAMERLNDHLNGVVTELRRLGVVANRKNFNLTKLLTGKLSELTVVLDPVEAREDSSRPRDFGRDPFHRVTLDLATGTAIVSCNKDSRNDAAAAWDIAKFKAELSGETDVLMEFARAFNEPAEQARITKIMRERKITPPH